MKLFSLLVGGIFVIVLSGCGTSSKVDKFLANYGDEQVIQKPIENYTGSDDSLSEQLLLEGMANVPSSEDYGEYTTYEKVTLSNALEDEKSVVLIVVDEGCDICKELEGSVSTSLSRIPSDVIIMKIEFTQAESLYGVKEMNSVIYLTTDGSVRYFSDGGIASMDNLLYYL